MQARNVASVVCAAAAIFVGNHSVIAVKVKSPEEMLIGETRFERVVASLLALQQEQDTGKAQAIVNQIGDTSAWPALIRNGAVDPAYFGTPTYDALIRAAGPATDAAVPAPAERDAPLMPVACSGNLVPNGDFETYTTCPNFIGQVSYAPPWFLPTLGSSDLFHTCAGSGPNVPGVPQNYYTYKFPHSGNGYMNFRLYGQVPPNTTVDYREYLEVPLNASLLPGQTYTLSFWISRDIVGSNFGISDVSAYFSAGPVYANTGVMMPVTPQWTYGGPPITTGNWQYVTGTYVAAGGENHMTLGNFKSDANSNWVFAPGGCCPVASYCLDDVCLIGPAGTLNGACCYQGAAGPVCQILTSAQCAALNGLFYGKGSNCNNITCGNVLYGACCIAAPGGNICQIKTPTQCSAAGGTYLGNGSTCTPGDPCNPPTGSCCYQQPGNPILSCIITTQALCASQYNGTYNGNNTSCFPDPCNPQGACCYTKPGFPQTFCVTTNQVTCVNQYGGTYLGNNVPCPSQGSCDPNPPKGACCYQIPGTTFFVCSPMTAANCALQFNSTYYGNGSSCATVNCATPMTGACCYMHPDGTGPRCSVVDSQTCVAVLHGTFLGIGVPCTPTTCNPPTPTGACCYFDVITNAWTCVVTTQTDCQQNYPQSTYMGNNVPCTPNPCAPFVTGACCYLLPDGTPGGCVITNQADCTSTYNGTYMGNNTTCNPNPCLPSGACCYQTAAGPQCIVATQADCTNIYHGTWQGPNTTCNPNPCVPSGACCYMIPGSTIPQCAITTQTDCLNQYSGTWLGANTTCNPNPCDPPGACCYQQTLQSPITCVNVTQSQCASFPNSVWQGANTTCGPNACPSGACCYKEPGTTSYLCAVTTLGNCVNNLHGNFMGVGSTCASVNCNPCVYPLKKMVAWWKLDEILGGVANDSIAGHHGGYKPTPATGPTPISGMVDDSLGFDGINDFVKVAHSPALNFNCSAFSIDAWIRPGSFAGGIVNKSGAPGYDFYIAPSGQLGLKLTTSGPSCTLLSTGTIAINAWTHVAVTATAGGTSRTVTFYINGAASGSFVTSCVCVGNSAPLLIGSSSVTGLLRGKLDEIEIFNRVITASEVLSVYNAGSSGKCKARVKAPLLTPFCLNQNSVTVPITICNDAPTPYSFNVSFQPLNTCTIPGPTVFTPLFSNPVNIAANSCVTVNVTINRPVFMTAVNQVACYQVTALNTTTGIASYGQGSVKDRRDLCAVIGPCCISTGGISLGVGTIGNVSVNVTNTVGVAVTVPYMIKAFDSQDGTPSDALRLNGLPPGTRYIGNLTLPSGGGTTLDFTAQYLENNPLAFDDIVVLTDIDQDGTFDPLISISARSIPVLCDADLSPDPEGNGTVDIDDLVWVITHWGGCPQPCSAGACAGDVNDDCLVNIDDLVKVITSWGPCP